LTSVSHLEAPREELEEIRVFGHKAAAFGVIDVMKSYILEGGGSTLEW
jgi:hypothetical protein